MSKYKFTITLLFVILTFSSCSAKELPDRVKITEHEYVKSFSTELYPKDETFPKDEGINLSGNIYHEFTDSKFPCYIAYDQYAEPNIYFQKEQAVQALSYYNNAENFNYFCLMGNIHDSEDQEIIELQKIDFHLFDLLLEYSSKNEYNPLTTSNNEKGLKYIEIPDLDDWMADEIHFYKECKDGSFTTSRAYTFVQHENKLYFLYQYDLSNEDAPKMLLKAIPETIEDYFLPLIRHLKNQK